MRFIAIAILMGAFSAHAVDISLEDAQKVWQDFLTCGKNTKVENLKKCSESWLYSEAPSTDKQKILQMLDQEIPFSKLDVCDVKADMVPAVPVKGGVFYCMQVQGTSYRSPGYVIFRRENQKTKIVLVKYKF